MAVGAYELPLGFKRLKTPELFILDYINKIYAYFCGVQIPIFIFQVSVTVRHSVPILYTLHISISHSSVIIRPMNTFSD
jgi:hypothetical protein